MTQFLSFTANLGWVWSLLLDFATGFCGNIANVGFLWLEFNELGSSGSMSLGENWVLGFVVVICSSGSEFMWAFCMFLTTYNRHGNEKKTTNEMLVLFFFM